MNSLLFLFFNISTVPSVLSGIGQSHAVKWIGCVIPKTARNETSCVETIFGKQEMGSFSSCYYRGKDGFYISLVTTMALVTDESDFQIRENQISRVYVCL